MPELKKAGPDELANPTSPAKPPRTGKSPRAGKPSEAPKTGKSRKAPKESASPTPALPAQKRLAASLLSEGLSLQEVAEKTGGDEDTVMQWMREPETMAVYREKLAGQELVSYARAVRRILGQMDDENPMVALRAAKEALEKFQDALGGEKEMRIYVEGMPELGMPSLHGEDEM